MCPRCAPGGCARDVPQVCFVPEVCPRCAPGVPEIVPQVCPRCAPGVHRQITELPQVVLNRLDMKSNCSWSVLQELLFCFGLV